MWYGNTNSSGGRTERKVAQSTSIVSQPWLWWFDGWLRPSSKDSSLIVMECSLYRGLCCRENVSPNIWSLFILLGRETMFQSPQNTKPHLSVCLVCLCSVNLTKVVFYEEGLLSGNPGERGLRSELLQRGEGCASRAGPPFAGK